MCGSREIMLITSNGMCGMEFFGNKGMYEDRVASSNFVITSNCAMTLNKV